MRHLHAGRCGHHIEACAHIKNLYLHPGQVRRFRVPGPAGKTLVAVVGPLEVSGPIAVLIWSLITGFWACSDQAPLQEGIYFRHGRRVHGRNLFYSMRRRRW